MTEHASVAAPVRRRLYIHLIPSAVIGVLLTLALIFNEPAPEWYERVEFLAIFLASIPPSLAANRFANAAAHWQSNDKFWGAALFGGVFWSVSVAAGWVISTHAGEALFEAKAFDVADVFSSIFTGTMVLGVFLVPIHFHFSFAQRRAAAQATI